MTRVLRAAALALALLAVVFAVGGVVAAEGALRPWRRPIRPVARELAAGLARAQGRALEEPVYAAPDGAQLRAWFFRAAKPGGRAVILLHGVIDNRAAMLGFAQMFLDRGYDVLAADSRAHGESGGPLATYGLLEAADLNRWAVWLRERQGARCVFALGESMGAAIIIQALADPRTPLCAAVAESSFSSFREVALLRMGQAVGQGERTGSTLMRPAAELGLLYARWRYGVEVERAAPAEAVRRVTRPLLVIHGLADNNIPPVHGRRIVANAGANVAFWQVPGAGHVNASAAAPEEFQRRVLAWFEPACGAP